MIEGKIPPQAKEVEEAILGALLIDKTAISEIADILFPEMFYEPAHQYVYSAIQLINNQSRPVDLVTVTDKLRDEGHLEIVGGAYAVTDFTNKVASAAHILEHARIVQEKHILRSLIEISTTTIKESYDVSNDVFDVVENAERNILTINTISGKGIRKASELTADVCREMEAAAQNVGVSGISSGFAEIDRITGGWRKANLIILAGQSGMGKTTQALEFARNAVSNNIPVVFFSLEMSASEVIKKMVAFEARLPLWRVTQNRVDPAHIETFKYASQVIDGQQMYVDDTGGLRLFEIRSRLRRLTGKVDFGLVVVDYLQIMGTATKGRTREQEVAEIAIGLKNLSKEFDVPVIALSQLNRKVSEGDGRPKLHHLRESGALEQVADLVIFSHRDDYQGQESDGAGVVENNIAKNRHGKCGTAYSYFDEETTTYYDRKPEPEPDFYN